MSAIELLIKILIVILMYFILTTPTAIKIAERIYSYPTRRKNEKNLTKYLSKEKKKEFKKNLKKQK